MEDSYCLKCRDHTMNIEPYYDVSRNNRLMMRSECEECGGNKCMMMGGSAALVGAIARAAPEVTKNVGAVLQDVTGLIGEQLERGHEKRQVNKKYERQAARHAKKIHSIKQKEFSKYKKLMKKGEFPQMSDQDLFDYIGSGLNNQGLLYDDGMNGGYDFY